MKSRRVSRVFVTASGRAVSMGAVVAAAAIGSASGAARAQDARFDLIALTGDPAPGLTDVTLGRLSLPRLNDAGALVLVSELEGASVTEADNGALWGGSWIVGGAPGSAGPLSVVIRKGDAAPTTAPGGEPVDFVAFPYPALSPSGRVGFTGSTWDAVTETQGPDAIFIEDGSGSFVSVAEAFYPQEPGYFTSLPIAPLTPDATAPFNADSAGYIGSLGGQERLLGQGDPATGTAPDYTIDFVDLPQVGADGSVAMRASAMAPEERFDRHQSLWRREAGAGAVELVAWADPREPGPGEILFTDFGVSPWVGDGDEMFFWASIKGDSVTADNDAAVWAAGGALPGISEIIREGDPVSGLSGVTIGKLSRQIAVNDFEQMALMTSLAGAVTTDDNTAILASDGGPALGVLVREGDAAPGAGGAEFHSLSDPAINHAGQVAFLAQLRGGGLELDEKFGLYMTDRQGQVHEVVRTGTMFDVRGDGSDIREVRQIEFASDPARTGHSQFAFDGSVAVLLTFEDWDSGIYVASVGCLADADGDGDLSFFDFLEFQNQFAERDPRADMDADGAFTFFDFLAFQNAFAAGCAD